MSGSDLASKATTLTPTMAEAIAAYGAGRLSQAIEGCRDLLKANPNIFEAWYLMTAIHSQLGQWNEALEANARALKVRADIAEVHNIRGTLLQNLQRLDEARLCYEKAVELKPGYAAALGNCGCVLHKLGQPQDAIHSYEKALRIEPTLPGLHYNYGAALHELERLDEALASYDRALRIKPDFAEALCNRGNLLKELGRVDEAVSAYDKALLANPDLPDARQNRAITCLLKGDFAAGWRELEARFETSHYATRHPVPPGIRWTGEPLAGKTILVHAEQGSGDVIQYARYLPILAKQAGKVLFQPPANLARLLGTLPGGVTLLSDRPPAAFDFATPLMSVPYRVGTSLDSVPRDVPYLAAEQDRIDRWRARIGTHGFKIGICWQVNSDSPAAKGRSAPLASFAPLQQIPGVRLFSLQKHHGLDQIATLPNGMAVETFGDDYDAGPDAFVDTAAAMTLLDLVVTVDTAIVHLAGALGRPTWLAIQRVPYWTWMLDRTDSPWYPTVRLFRQAERGRWDSVFADMAGALRSRLR